MKARHDQHFLIDKNAIHRIADLEDVKGKTVLEVGPGNGALTRALLDRGALVHAVELDGILCEGLADLFSEEIQKGTLTVTHGDATRCDFLPFEMVVSNLPYSVSSKITFRLLDIGFAVAVLMFQEEFARRMAAPAGTKDCGRLSIMVQTYAAVQQCFTLPPTCFSPKPQVHSMVVKIFPRASDLWGQLTKSGTRTWCGRSLPTGERRCETASGDHRAFLIPDGQSALLTHSRAKFSRPAGRICTSRILRRLRILRKSL